MKKWIVFTDVSPDGRVVLGNGRPYHVQLATAPHLLVADCCLESDACLIAAAPDLLAACHGLLEMITDSSLHGAEISAAVAAIARAEGER